MGAERAPGSSHRLAWLDGLRGLTALAVVLFHFVNRYDEMHPGGRPDLGGLDLHFGKYGVHVFFVVSGFVMMVSLARTARSSDYVIGRVSRLWPAYAASVLVTTAVLWTYGHLGGPTWGEVLVNLTMLEGFVGVPYVDGVYWTLTYELMFYGVMFFVHRFGQMRNIEAWIAAWAAAHVLNVAVLIPAGLGSGLVRELMIEEGVFFFASGILVSRIVTDGWSWSRGLLLPAMVAGSALCQTSEHVAALVFTLLVMGLGFSGRLEVLAARPFVWLGTLTYTLYLLHQMIGYVVIDLGVRLGAPSWPVVAVALVVVTFLAEGMTRLVEVPGQHAVRNGWKRWSQGWGQRAAA